MGKKVVITKDAPAPIGPYSQAVSFGNLLFVSGQIAIDPASGELLTEDLNLETHRVMGNLEAVLAAADMTFDNVLKASIFLSDLGSFSSVNEVYASYFQNDPPARETVEVSRLPKDVNVEISVIAAN